MRYNLKTVLACVGICVAIITTNVKAETENQRAKTAEKYFLAKQYDKACPLYAQLVSSSPKNYKYNYYYGICILISGKDKSMAMPYLEMAIQNPKTPEDIYYYIARALHLNYRFDESLRAFSEFNSIIGSKNTGRWSTLQYMAMCNNAKVILDSTKNDQILERTEVLSGEFFNQYKFNSPNGKLLTMPDEIIKSTGSSELEKPMIFLSGNGRVMFYSAVNSATNSRDIYRMDKDLDNNWGAPICLDQTINTPEDEILPTSSNDGRILYWSTRGGSSTGGFDIMKSYYNTVSKTWTSPENMGSPVNSPDDDFCFVASTSEQISYFTSQRETGQGYLTAYKANYSDSQQLPIAINGRFKAVGEPNLKNAQIVISRDGEEKIVAEINTDSINGTYSVELPGSGTYRFKVSAQGYQTQTQDVVFSTLIENVIVQDIYLSKNLDGTENLAISNRRLTESGLIDESLTANVDENGNITSGITSNDIAGNGFTTTSTGINSATGEVINGSGYSGNNMDGSSTSLSGIYFKVQIGAFKTKSVEIIEKRLEKSVDKTQLTNYADITWLRFFIGKENTYSSAKNLKTTLVQAGFKDAFIVAFQGEKTMSLQTAIKAKAAVAEVKE
jgi:hypothetical protein